MIAAVIPTKDEPDVEHFIKRVGQYVDRILVVDDSSDDPGWRHPKASISCGVGSLGGSLGYGLDFFHSPGSVADRVVTIDAGWSHDPNIIPDLLAVDADVVIGSRFCRNGFHRGPAWRSWSSRMYGRLWRWTTGYRVRDWTSGYRVYSPAALAVVENLELRSRRHAVQPEILIACLDAGLTVQETPIYYRVMPGSTMSRAASREALGLWWRYLWA